MKEIAQILDAYGRIDTTVQKAALATVVHVEGSSYRRAGARMLITDDGRLTGAISGGCLEGDALRKALLVMHQERAVVVRYDTTDEDDAKLGIGLGCNGIIYILIEPILATDPGNPLQLLLRARSERQRAVLVTLFSLADKRSVPPGTSFMLTENDEKYSSIADQELSGSVEKDVRRAMQSDKSFVSNYQQNQLSGFIEVLQPTVRLVIYGAGNDVVPVTEMAHILGWETIVIDGRATHAKTERFPMAKQVLVSKPEYAVDLIEADEQTYFLLMTHNYNYDLEIFRQLSDKRAAYIGVLGPRKKLQRMMDEAGRAIDQSTVYGPVGLDIGAEAAEEIALSIISEIKAVSEGRDGQSLRNKGETIHSRPDQFSSVVN